MLTGKATSRASEPWCRSSADNLVGGFDRGVYILRRCTATSSHFTLLAVAAAACGSGVRLPRTTVDNPNDASKAMYGADDGAASQEDSGTYHSGSAYTCCGPGNGLTCCTADAGLLGYDVRSDGAIVGFGARPGGTTEANCFQYGGILGACADVGVQFDGKEPCVLCCPGLVRVNVSFPSDAGPDPCLPAISIFECSLHVPRRLPVIARWVSPRRM